MSKLLNLPLAYEKISPELAVFSIM